MVVLKRNHYIAALVVLALVVLFAVWRGGGAGKTPESSESGSVSVQSEADESALNASVQVAPESGEGKLIGVWIPYMSLSTAEKTEAAFKANYDAKLESAKAMGVNAVFVHVRPFADSLYSSEYEPWSHILTGKQGEDPGYDPLAYMVEKAHENGMEFHAWVNPLRIATASTPGTLDENSFYMQNREENPYYFLTYDGGIYYNPASAYIRGRIADSTAEIAANYEVDGI
ncbi:MAG: glycoside hydrolase family 10 protein, partial [Hominenteromicrobium sp.]